MRVSPRGSVLVLLLVLLLAACGSVESPKAERPSPLPTPPRALDVAVRACVLASACAKPDDPVSLREPSACVARVLAHAAHDPRVACLEQAKSCRDVEVCVGRESNEDAKRACDARPGTLVLCDGDRLLSCESERERITSCAELRGACRELRVAGGIVVRGCFSSALCPDGAPAQRCDGGASVISCQQGLVERTRCPPATRCVEGAVGGEVEATCVPVGERPCVPGSIDRCDGERVVSCVTDGRRRGVVVETDCASSGLTCRTSGREGGCAVAEVCAQGPARCDGAALRFCAAGLPVRAACDRYGLGPCKSDGVRSWCSLR